MRYHENEATETTPLSDTDEHTQMEIPATLADVPEEQADEIGEQLKVKNYVFQFIDHETGKRSEPFVGKYDTLKQIINVAQEREQKPTDDDYILLVCVLGDNDEDTIIPGTPLIKVATFMQLGA